MVLPRSTQYLYRASLPSRGAWIEIVFLDGAYDVFTRRSPRGERGLKLAFFGAVMCIMSSLPSRGAWIEIGVFWRGDVHYVVAPLAGSVD